MPIRCTGKTLLILCVGALGASVCFAHGDASGPLFVAADGVDSGHCDERAAPCATIGYALRVSGKGARIRVATGTYPVENTEDLFHIVGGGIDIRGGYAPGDDLDGPGSGISILTGVPPEFREELRSQGFYIVADRKGIEGPRAAETEKLLALQAQLAAGLAATPCTGGSAAGLACASVDLLAHVAFGDVSAKPAAANDIWGFTDLNTNREYAIVGFNTGTAVFDVTDPQVPREVGFVAGQNTTWRDIKVYQYFDTAADRWHAYAYVTADGATDGLFVIDLGDLPQAIHRRAYTSDFFSAHNVYAAGSDYATGVSLTGDAPLLIIAGSSIGNGQFRAYSLADPGRPAFVGGASSPDYMHDAASLQVRDQRKDSQCANAGPAGCEVLLDFNETSIDIWDVSVPSTPVRLSRLTYSNSGYTHSGWPTEDGMYAFVQDELDEQRFGINTTLRVVSLADLRAPVVVGSWTGPTTAIDHNGFVRGNRYYMSNYSRGLTVLDITNPVAPAAAGSFDTYPFSDGSSFVGAWGAYPYFSNGTIAISDIGSGLYLVADRTRDVPQGSLSFTGTSFAATEGTTAQLTVRRHGGSSGSISVAYRVFGATADATDFQVAAGRLDWTDGDTADKVLPIDTIDDGIGEGLERVLVRLVDPRGGATLGDIAGTSLYVGDPGAGAEIVFAEPSIDVPERGFGTAVVVLHRRGSAVGTVTVDYAITGGDAVPGTDFTGAASGTVSWADGDGDPKWLEFPIVDDGVSEPPEYFDLALGNAVGGVIAGPATLRVTIQDAAGTNPGPVTVGGGGGKGGGALDLPSLGSLVLFALLVTLSRMGGGGLSSARDRDRSR